MFVSERITDEYLKWQLGDTIYITAPTGRGKSQFIIRILLNLAAKENKKILYLVNRVILKRQVEEDIIEVSEGEEFRKFNYNGIKNIKDNISVMTYQSIENSLKRNEFKDFIQSLKRFDYVIYDEAHYFYADSTFNTNTELSYDCLRRIFDFKIQIFLSATMERTKQVMDNRTVTYLFGEAHPHLTQGGIDDYGNAIERKKVPRKEYVYELPMEYDYVKVKSFAKLDDLVGVIVANVKEWNEKWLIFTDSIDKGKEFQKKLIEKISLNSDDNSCSLTENDVFFIDATFKKDKESLKQVEQIAKQKSIDKKVIISTAVMDNGISFHDNELRNMVILADTKETFLQMLGRKREDGQEVKLYICERTADYFQQRLQETERILSDYRNYLQPLEKAWQIRENIGCIHKLNPYTYLEFSMQLFPNPYYQQSLLDTILAQGFINDSICHTCYSLRGVLSVNAFAINKYLDLKDFYKRMHKEMLENPDAFIKEQANWLNMKDTEHIERADNEIKEAYADELKIALEELLREETQYVWSQQDNLRFKNAHFNAFLYFVESNKSDNFKKKDRPISKEDFNDSMKNSGLLYRLCPDKEKHTRIERIDFPN